MPFENTTSIFNIIDKVKAKGRLNILPQEQATSSLLLPTVVPHSNSNGTTVLKSTSTTTTSTQSPVNTINNILIRHHVKNPFIAQRKKLFSPGRPRFGAKTRIRQPHLQLQSTFKKLSRHTFKPKYFTTTAPRSTSAAASVPSITTFRRTASTTTSGTPTSTKTFYPTPTVADVTSPAPTTTTTTTTSTTTAAKHHTTTIWVTPPSSSFPHFNVSTWRLQFTYAWKYNFIESLKITPINFSIFSHLKWMLSMRILQIGQRKKLTCWLIKLWTQTQGQIAISMLTNLKM